MSLKAMAWAKDQRTGAPATKVVLLCLADAHNGHTELCCPSIERLAEETEMSVRSVQEHIKHLVEAGLVVVSRRDGGFGNRKTNAYEFPALSQPAEFSGCASLPAESACTLPATERTTTGNMLPVHREREIEQEKAGGDSREIEEALTEYQLIAEQIGLSKVSKLSDSRRAHLRARIREHGLPAWRAAMRSIPQSRYLSKPTGSGKFPNWRPDFDWFVTPTNFLKLIEGKYHDGRPPADDQLALGAPDRSEDAKWRDALIAFYDKGIWVNGWGPKPGERGCPVPDDVLTRFLSTRKVSA